MNCKFLPFFSTAVLLVLFFPLYFLDWSFLTAAPLGFSLAYFSAFRPRLLALWPLAFAVPALYKAGVVDATVVLWYLVFTTAAAYGLAALVGSGVCRLVSLAVFWVVEQVVPWVVSLPLSLVGYTFGAPLPHFWEYPLYIAVYWTFHQTHGRAVNWCQRRVEKPELTCWWERRGDRV